MCQNYMHFEKIHKFIFILGKISKNKWIRTQYISCLKSEDRTYGDHRACTWFEPQVIVRMEIKKS